MRKLLLVGVMFVVACGDGSSPAPAGGTEQGVVTRVDSTGTAPAVVVSGEASLGSLDTVMSVRDGFASVRSVLLDPAGGVWVLDHGARKITRYDDAGVATLSLGSAGDGKAAGNYLDPYSLAWGGGDLMVYDPGGARVGRWRADGTWVGSWNAIPITGGSNARFFPSGSNASAWLFQFSFLSNGRPAPGFARYPLTPRGDVRWIPPTERGALQDIVLCTVGATERAFTTPFTQGELWQPSLDGHLYYLRGVDYAISTVDSAGTTLRTIRREVQNHPITDGEWEAAGAPLDSFRTAHPGSCNGSFTRPAAKAAVRALTLDDRGHLWVERSVTDGYLWEVWEGDRLIGAIPGVDRNPAVPVDVRGDRLAVAATGPDGRSEVRVYRFRLPGPIAPSPAAR